MTITYTSLFSKEKKKKEEKISLSFKERALRAYDLSKGDSYAQSLRSFESFYQNWESSLELTHGQHENPTLYSAFLAFEGENVVGFLHTETLFDRSEVDYLFVKEDYRQKGIAKALFEKFLEHTRSTEVKKITLEAGAFNLKAIRFYESLGFQKIHVRPLYYKNKEDAFILEKVL
jgi:ribosomal-protein-alanine N-acetyltransferase